MSISDAGRPKNNNNPSSSLLEFPLDFFHAPKRWAKKPTHRSTNGRTVIGPKRDLGVKKPALKTSKILRPNGIHDKGFKGLKGGVAQIDLQIQTLELRVSS